MSSENKVEFWFEFGSTYSYPAALRIERLCSDAGVELVWRPFLLGPIFGEQGWSDSPFNIYPAKGRYMWRDLERVCATIAVPFRRPSVFPRSGLLAARVACWFENETWVPEFVRRVYTANFAYDRNISDTEEILAILNAMDQPPSVLAAAESAESKAKLRSQTQQAIALGIFGAPSFLVGDELFWGNDRLEAAIDWGRFHGTHST